MHAVMLVAMDAEYYEEGNADLDDYVGEQTAPYDQNNEEYYTGELEDCCDDPNCNVCAGTGTFESKYNANGIFDWWEIGGRWNNAIYDLEYELNKNRNYVGNVIKVGDRHFLPHGEGPSGIIPVCHYVIDTDRSLVTDIDRWLTDPQNQDKYVVLVDYHS